MIHEKGFSLVELAITIGIIGILGLGVFSAWVIGLQVTSEKRAEVAAHALAIEKLERAKTLPYTDVGTMGGIPSGTLPQQETVERNAVTYTVRTAVLYVDDPFDGVAPTDAIPTDYKRIRIEVSWSGKYGVSPVVLMTDSAPKGLETNSGGGTLFFRVVDATAQPVADATVVVQNTRITPAINLTLTTNSAGQIMLPGAPPSQEGYDVTVTKEGYGNDGTIRAQIGVNPSPTKPPLSVFEGNVTEAVFTIDRLATLTIRTVDNRGSQSWWRSTYPYRKNITLTNNGENTTERGTPIRIVLDHATLVREGKSLANGNDVRVVFFNGTYFEDLHRINTTAWNTEATQLWFATKRAIPKDEGDEGYAIYYGNILPDPPLASPASVFPPPLNADTIGLWYLDDGPGSTTARDASGYGHDGTLQNLDPQTAWVQGKFGTALAFNGGCCPHPHVRVAPTPTLANVDHVTVEAWVYPTELTGNQTIISKAENTKATGTFHFYQYFQSICFFVWKNPNPYDGRVCGSPIRFNAWNHVAGTYDGHFLRVFMNGALVGTAEKPGILEKTQWVEVNIGRHAHHNWEPYFGRIDTVAIHRTARTNFSYGVNTTIESELSSERNYQQPNAIGNVPVTITGAKIVGADDTGKPIPKFTQTRTSDGSGTITLTSIEPDTYAATLDGAGSAYDIAATLPLLPIVVPPASLTTERLTLLTHRDHTLLVTVKDKQVPLDGASVQLTNASGYNKTIVTGESGQAFFTPLTGDTIYTVAVTKPSYTSATTTVHVQQQTYEDIPLAPL